MKQTKHAPDTKTKTQGGRANSNGRAAEDALEAILKSRNLNPERQKPIGVSIFGGQLITDLYIPVAPGLPDGFAVESKWQNVSGSADQKLCYLEANIREGRYPCPVIVIIGGNGMTEGAKSWIRRQVDGTKLYAVFTWEEFFSWLMTL